MKFLYADSLDFIDPSYDFEQDRAGKGRRRHEDDHYPHEHLDFAPYDGLLISRATVGSARRKGKYSDSQCVRFTREGARRFLRYPLSKYPDSMVMGDCGAFSYRNMTEPPYTVDDMLDFYEDGGFTHGCSVDHVIFGFDGKVDSPSLDVRRRYDLTIENAREFIRKAKRVKGFTPVGVIQGWSPRSMASAARNLVAMGYRYLAVGGLVPMRTPQIATALGAIRDAVPSHVRLHALGFGKSEDLDVLRFYNVSSFDTTSPLYRAFKDKVKNYYSLRPDGDVDYYTALRIPQAIDNLDLIRRAKRGRLNSDKLLALETHALAAVRAYGKNGGSVKETVKAVIDYGHYALWDEKVSDSKNEERLRKFSNAYIRTLRDRPWDRCHCRICREIGVEVMIFRSSNRNKRRGIHNLHVFYASVRGNDAGKH